MGDFATRLCDGEHIKVGTCGAMYYCRYEQINEIEMDGHYNLNGCLWRIPLPSEDGIKPGEYDSGLVKGSQIPYDLLLNQDDFSEDMKQTLAETKGIVQAYIEELGILINMTCFHGFKRPEGGGGIYAGWNGKRDPLFLSHLENGEKELLVGIQCNACHKMWSTTFNEIEPYIVSLDMKLRLFKQCSEYWWKHNTEPCPYEVNGMHNRKSLKMVCMAEGIYDVLLDNRCVSEESSFEANEKMFRNMIIQRV